MKRLPILVLALFFMPIVSIAILGFSHSFHTRELKAQGQVGTFTLTDTFNQEFTEKRLYKKVWIASFVFTHCDEQCPRIGAALEKLQKALYSKENIRLVTFSVDPKRDTPERLMEFGKRFNFRSNRWALLTGDQREIDKLLQLDFKLAGGQVEGNPMGMMTHSNYFVLVDGFGTIRGRYDAFDEEKMKELIVDAKSLLRGLY